MIGKRWGTLVGVIVLLAAASVGAATVTVADMAQRTVSAPFDAGRIVCLGPGALRLIVYLQAEDRVVGVEEMEKRTPRGRPYWMAHPGLAQLPVVGPGGPASINKKPDLEALLRVRPEVIFVTYMDAALADEVQQTLGVPVVVLSYGAFATFDDAVFQALRVAGEILNRTARAEAVVNFIEDQRRELQRRTAEIPPEKRARVYVGGIGHRGAHGIESTEQQYIPLAWVKADNLAERVEARVGSHLFVDKEILLKLDPEMIFIDGGGLELVAIDYHKKPDYYQSLQAFKNRRVYTLMPFNFYTTNIGTAIANAWAVGKRLYPERFDDIDPATMADTIYTFLLGVPVYDQMQADWGPIGAPAGFGD